MSAWSGGRPLTHQSHLAYLETLLEAEVEERERNVVARRIKEARFPKVKTLEDFDFTMAPHLPASLIRTLGAGDWIGRAEPVMLLGDAGTGKTHLAIALAVVACRQRKRVRFTTAAELVNDLMERAISTSRVGCWRAGCATRCSWWMKWRT